MWICESFSLTRNSCSLGFLLKLLNFVRKNLANNSKCNFTFTHFFLQNTKECFSIFCPYSESQWGPKVSRSKKYGNKAVTSNLTGFCVVTSCDTRTNDVCYYWCVTIQYLISDFIYFTLPLCPFWSLKCLDPIDFHCMDKTLKSFSKDKKDTSMKWY